MMTLWVAMSWMLSRSKPRAINFCNSVSSSYSCLSWALPYMSFVLARECVGILLHFEETEPEALFFFLRRGVGDGGARVTAITGDAGGAGGGGFSRRNPRKVR